MKAVFMHGAGDVRVETVPDPDIERPTDAIVRTLRACICGSDLHPYHSLARTAPAYEQAYGIVRPGGIISTGASTPARSSTTPSASMTSRPGTRPWTPARR